MYCFLCKSRTVGNYFIYFKGNYYVYVAVPVYSTYTVKLNFLQARKLFCRLVYGLFTFCHASDIKYK